MKLSLKLTESLHLGKASEAEAVLGKPAESHSNTAWLRSPGISLSAHITPGLYVKCLRRLSNPASAQDECNGHCCSNGYIFEQSVICFMLLKRQFYFQGSETCSLSSLVQIVFKYHVYRHFSTMTPLLNSQMLSGPMLWRAHSL